MTELGKETEAKLSELATTIALHDRPGSTGWRELVLSDPLSDFYRPPEASS